MDTRVIIPRPKDPPMKKAALPRRWIFLQSLRESMLQHQRSLPNLPIKPVQSLPNSPFINPLESTTSLHQKRIEARNRLYRSKFERELLQYRSMGYPVTSAESSPKQYRFIDPTKSLHDKDSPFDRLQSMPVKQLRNIMTGVSLKRDVRAVMEIERRNNIESEQERQKELKLLNQKQQMRDLLQQRKGQTSNLEKRCGIRKRRKEKFATAPSVSQGIERLSTGKPFQHIYPRNSLDYKGLFLYEHPQAVRNLIGKVSARTLVKTASTNIFFEQRYTEPQQGFSMEQRVPATAVTEGTIRISAPEVQNTIKEMDQFEEYNSTTLGKVGFPKIHLEAFKKNG